MEALSATSLLPGFGFHPTDVELISHYLKRKVRGQKIDFNIIPEVDIYKHEPWDLPAKCEVPTKDSKWHFFTSRDRKYPNGSRTNRATEGGYWKSTGKDRNIKSQNRVIGSKKTLVFHQGRPPTGTRTDWIMHEYYIDEKECKAAPDMKDSYVLCRVTKRNGLPSEADNSPLPEEVNNHPQQPNETTESVICDNSTSPPDNVDDINAWLDELLDPNPNFSSITAPEDLTVEPEEGVTSVESKLEPVDSSVEQNILDDSNFLFEEDVYSILFSNPDIYNYNLLEDLAMGNTDASFASTNGNWLTESSHNFTPAPNLEDEFFDNKALTHMNENNDAGIQIRTRHKKVAEASGTKIRLQVQLHKMETREAESVKLVDHYSHVDLVKEITESKSSLGSDDDSQKSGTLINGISYNRRVMRGFFVPPRDRSSAGLSRSFVGAFTVAIVGLILYVLFHYASRFTGSFSSIGYT